MIKFNNPKLLLTALTHRSALNEKKGSPASNERLEFLGDAVLELVVSNYLYQTYPTLAEGQLTLKRAQLVQTKTLAAAAKKIGLGEKLILSRGEKKAKGDQNPTLLANSFEAFVGALYLDQGLATVSRFIQTQLLNRSQKILKQVSIQDFKSQLQELWQKKLQLAPRYRIFRSFGPDHHKTFIVRLYCRNRPVAQGSGNSKQEAEQQAAKQALESPKKLC